jgi:hypothetical protein
MVVLVIIHHEAPRRGLELDVIHMKEASHQNGGHEVSAYHFHDRRSLFAVMKVLMASAWLMIKSHSLG